MQQPPNQDNFPFKEQRVIDELVEFWQTHNEPRDLTARICDTLNLGSTSVTSFLAKVRDDLRNNKHSNYTATSASEFRQFLEDEYRPYAERHAKRQAQLEAGAKAFDEAHATEWAEDMMKAELECQAQAKAAEAKRLAEAQAKRDEYVRKARAEIDVLGMLMVKTPDPNKRRELGRKRVALAQSIGIHLYGEYRNHCWSCKMLISSEINVRCPSCTLFICNYCGACFCNRTNNPLYYQADDPFLPDYPDDLS